VPKPEFTLDDMLRLGAENNALKAKVTLLRFNIEEIRRDLHDGDQQAPGKNVEVREALVVRAIERLDGLLRTVPP
jgi:hypothetical protein